MSFLDRVKGIFVEEVQDPTEELPATLQPVGAQSRVGRVSPTSRASTYVGRPDSPAQPEPLVVPEALRSIIDEQFGQAAAPALSAWLELNVELADTVPDPVTRARVVVKSIGKQGHTTEAVMTDIAEAQAELTRLKGGLEAARGAELEEKAVAREAEAEALRRQAEELQAKISEINVRAAALDQEALAARGTIDRDMLAASRYIDDRSRELEATARELRSLSVPTTPAK